MPIEVGRNYCVARYARTRRPLHMPTLEQLPRNLQNVVSVAGVAQAQREYLRRQWEYGSEAGQQRPGIFVHFPSGHGERFEPVLELIIGTDCEEGVAGASHRQAGSAPHWRGSAAGIEDSRRSGTVPESTLCSFPFTSSRTPTRRSSWRATCYSSSRRYERATAAPIAASSAT